MISRCTVICNLILISLSLSYGWGVRQFINNYGRWPTEGHNDHQSINDAHEIRDMVKNNRIRKTSMLNVQNDANYIINAK